MAVGKKRQKGGGGARSEHPSLWKEVATDPLQLGPAAYRLLKGHRLGREDRACVLAVTLLMLSLLEPLEFQPDSQLKEWPSQGTS